MMKFIKDMFSGSGEVSSKRVAGLLALLCAIIGIFCALLAQTAFDSLLMYSATLLSASVVTSIFNKK
jgi:hypothetical protein